MNVISSSASVIAEPSNSKVNGVFAAVTLPANSNKIASAAVVAPSASATTAFSTSVTASKSTISFAPPDPALLALPALLI